MEFSEILPEVLPSTPGCPTVVAINAIRNAVRDFCEQSHAWREWAREIEPQEGRNEYTVTGGPPDSEFIALVRVEDARAVFMPPNRLIFERVPGSPVRPMMALKPGHEAVEVPDWLGALWRTTFAEGALYRLMRMPQVEWTNPELAGAHRQAFWSDVNRAKVEAARDHAHGDMRVRPRRFV